METNLTKAEQTVDQLCNEIRDAHKDAIASGNQFAEIVLLAILSNAAFLRNKIEAASAAANSK